tara:strand:- start:2066 stop:4627 length:2562 start_codon:yes stop_codon:yes gene_type:complete
MQTNPTMSNQEFDTSNFTITSSNKGYGLITVSGTISIGSGSDARTFQVNNSYNISEEDNFIKVTTSIKNTGTVSITNLRYWVGTKDDYVGGTDRPTKIRGNLVSGSFQALSNTASSSSALRITTAQEGVLFFTNSIKGSTAQKNYGPFTNTTNQNPASAAISSTNDGSYSMFVRMNDLEVGESDTFTWYYAASKLSELENVVSAVSNASINISSLIKTYGDNPFTISATSSSTGAFTYSSTDSNTATISGTLVTITNAGTTSITVSQDADLNYLAATTTITLTVNPLPITVTPESNQSKTIGEVDPVLSYICSPTTTSDLSQLSFSGSLSRISGEISGTYPIIIGSLANPNYNITLANVGFVINSDSDGIIDSSDNCPSINNLDQADSDGDGVGDVCDNCINTSNSSQSDNDGDAQGDVCDLDDDNDGVPDAQDAFPTISTESIDTDGDGIGDNADPDADNDGILDISDNCILISNINQADLDGDGTGDVCDNDADGDGYSYYNEASCGTSDFDANVIPLDRDGDFIADCVDDDDDNDGYYDIDDAFPIDSSEWLDTDSDGIGNNTDSDDDNDGWLDTIEINCETDPIDILSVPIDTDVDGEPNCIDTDDDNDTYLDTEDVFPLDPLEWLDTDLDGTGNNADTDDDNDEYLDTDEISCQSDPLDFRSLPLDFDGDLSPDCIDENDDNDYCLDIEDDFPLNKDLCKDCDNDQIDNQYEFDSDNDGYPDHRDAFICDPTEWLDNDLDGIGDNEDQDDNNDGFPDEDLIVSTVLTPKTTGLESTWKIINIEKYPFTSVKVYSPDGSEVYKSTNYQSDWKGTNIKNGNPLPTGPYYYRIVAGGDSSEIFDGWLYIFN